ncbi:YcgN family cysteine cluster protein [Caulobacter sp. S45]|uniref:YcgN family cysteine cluster protein n=1 Tax=Caulobacter sp. S45 TaxID=1641861 RepID=UPI00131DCB77|nr:YcgN family cysteine cluster protein [Caulobacter sp. S45]
MSDPIAKPDRPFWETTPLAEMTSQEWESLCDGCGRCCLVRFEDEDTSEIIPTRISCRLLNTETCACSNYPRRRRYVPDCIKLTPDKIEELTWMPRSCAYRRLYEGRGLASWHPLVSGDPESVHRAGVSVRGQVVSETALADVEDAIDFPAYDLMDEPPED